jgi:riboflavin kinase
MTDLKTQHLLTLSHLFSQGGRHNFVTITTTLLGKNIGKSQQAASLHLKELEDGGFIERIYHGRTFSVKITQKGYSEISTLYDLLSKSISISPTHLELTGKIVSGMGEGAYYMSLKGYTKQFKSKLGYIPFPGTLNVKLNDEKYVQAVNHLSEHTDVKIQSFSDGKRTFGWVKCFSGIINNKIDCELIILERTHHDHSIIEFISRKNIRKSLQLKDNSTVKIKIPITE